MPQVSIVMSVCKSTNIIHLKNALDSILNQTFQDFELIIVIDGKVKTNIKEMLDQYKKRDHRILLTCNLNNKGLAYSLNKAISLSSAEFIARMDDNDICFKNRLQRQLEYLQRHKNDICFTNFYFLDEDGKIISIGYSEKIITKIEKIISKKERLLWRLLIGNFIMHPTVVFRKKKICKIGGYDEDLLSSEDYDLWIRSIINNLSFGFIKLPLMCIRVPNQFNYLARINKQRTYYNWNAFILKKLNKDLYSFIKTPIEKICLWFLIKKVILNSYLIQKIPDNFLRAIIFMKDSFLGYRK